MSFPRLGLVLDGVKHDYYLIVLDSETDPLSVPCKECGHKLKVEVAIQQYGFWEDNHLVFCLCTDCGARVVFRQDLPFYWETEVQHG